MHGNTGHFRLLVGGGGGRTRELILILAPKIDRKKHDILGEDKPTSTKGVIEKNQ